MGQKTLPSEKLEDMFDFDALIKPATQTINVDPAAMILDMLPSNTPIKKQMSPKARNLLDNIFSKIE